VRHCSWAAWIDASDKCRSRGEERKEAEDEGDAHIEKNTADDNCNCFVKCDED
jgi:hypothetical protein